MKGRSGNWGWNNEKLGRMTVQNEIYCQYKFADRKRNYQSSPRNDLKIGLLSAEDVPHALFVFGINQFAN